MADVCSSVLDMNHFVQLAPGPGVSECDSVGAGGRGGTTGARAGARIHPNWDPDIELCCAVL